jgi:hypothetical protein
MVLLQNGGRLASRWLFTFLQYAGGSGGRQPPLINKRGVQGGGSPPDNFKRSFFFSRPDILRLLRSIPCTLGLYWLTVIFCPFCVLACIGLSCVRYLLVNYLNFDNLFSLMKQKKRGVQGFWSCTITVWEPEMINKRGLQGGGSPPEISSRTMS